MTWEIGQDLASREEISKIKLKGTTVSDDFNELATLVRIPIYSLPCHLLITFSSRLKGVLERKSQLSVKKLLCKR